MCLFTIVTEAFRANALPFVVVIVTAESRERDSCRSDDGSRHGMEPISETTVCESLLRFSERTFIRMMGRIMKIVFASGLPMAEGKS